jgi:hypothetical protein
MTLPGAAAKLIQERRDVPAKLNVLRARNRWRAGREEGQDDEANTHEVARIKA